MDLTILLLSKGFKMNCLVKYTGMSLISKTKWGTEKGILWQLCLPLRKKVKSDFCYLCLFHDSINTDYLSYSLCFHCSPHLLGKAMATFLMGIHGGGTLGGRLSLEYISLSFPRQPCLLSTGTNGILNIRNKAK